MKGDLGVNILEIKNLVRKFDNVIAVDNISFNIKEGEIYGLLGPNGAGKSTAINMICGLLTPNSGTITILGEDINKNSKNIRYNIGVVPQDIAIYDDLTAYENVAFFGSLYNIRGKELKQRSEEALEFVGLKDRAKELPSKFSGGMKRRLNIACALVHRPKLMIMDEPTVGIDPQSRNHILDSIKKLNKMGCTIIYTSHYMEEVESICTRIGIIDNGKLIVEGTKEELKQNNLETSSILITVNSVNEVNVDEIEKINGVLKVAIDKNTVIINTNTRINNLDQIIVCFNQNHIHINNLENKGMDLETVFLNLTGRNLRD